MSLFRSRSVSASRLSSYNRVAGAWQNRTFLTCVSDSVKHLTALVFYSCLNERSFKSEAFLSISIESLLTLFVVIFIFYCQTIIVKSMFSSYQIDLSSGNSSFIYISSVSFSFIMSATVQYMMFMLASKFLETLHFDEL